MCGGGGGREGGGDWRREGSPGGALNGGYFDKTTCPFLLLERKRCHCFSQLFKWPDVQFLGGGVPEISMYLL